MTDDLVKELRKAAYRNPGDWVCDMCGEAADRIEALTAENERLTEAYNSLGNKAVDQVAKMGTEIGRKDCEIDVLTADLTQSKREVERLRELLDAWLGLAREHLDTELAGRTFEALERTRK